MRLILLLPLLALALAGCSDESRCVHHEVKTRSMEPTLTVGDRVMVLPYSHEPQIGDIVLLNHPDYGTPVVHCIAIMDGPYIQTKGDASRLYDRAVKRDAIIGQAFKE